MAMVIVRCCRNDHRDNDGQCGVDSGAGVDDGVVMMVVVPVHGDDGSGDNDGS